MRNVVGIVALAAIMTGCATTKSVAPGLLNHSGVSIRTDSAGSKFIGKVEFTKDGHLVGKDALPLCVTKTVRNSSVNLTGPSSTYVSPLTGVAYSVSDTTESSGGQVLEYISNGGHEVVASGTSGYRFRVMGMPVQKYIRFTLNAKVSESGSQYRFENLTQASRNSGVVQNSGFIPVAAWESAEPERVYQALSDLADEMNRCISSR